MSAPPLCTIGYEGSTVAAFMESLAAAGIALLVDVRALPLSRKPGFSKRQLAAEAESRGMAYVHLRSLGTPKPGRDAARAGRTAEMREIFNAHLYEPAAQAALAELTTLAASRSCCLLCYEADHAACHRDIVADVVRVRTGQDVYHLMPEAGIRGGGRLGARKA